MLSLNLPIGVDNTPDALREVVELPPNNESANSEMGKQRFANNADLVILVNDPTKKGVPNVDVRGGGMANGTGANLKWASISNFVQLDKTFYDGRENKTINATEIDVSGLVAWNASANNALKKCHQARYQLGLHRGFAVANGQHRTGGAIGQRRHFAACGVDGGYAESALRQGQLQCQRLGQPVIRVIRSRLR